jgi:hypothetical protein
MSSNNPLEVIYAIYQFLALIVKTPIFIVGCIAQPFILHAHTQNDIARIARMAPLARRLRLKLSKDLHRNMHKSLRFLRKVDGRSQYAINIMTGQFEGHDVTLFDYHSRSINSDARVWEYSRWFNHNYVSFLVMDLGQEFPALSLDKESNGLDLLARVADAFGKGDIDFESHEFSRKFDVRGEDKKFAYDFCNVQMMEHLLSQPVVPIEVEKNALATVHNSTLKMMNIDASLNRLLAIRQRMPEFLFAG